MDNEPENLDAMIASRADEDVLFLHADTMFESQRPDGLRVVGGTAYELGGLITEDRLREHVELVWHGVNDEENLVRFLDSGIIGPRWTSGPTPSGASSSATMVSTSVRGPATNASR